MTRPFPIPESEFADALRLARAGRHLEALERVERLVADAPGEPRAAQAADALAHVAQLAEAAGGMDAAARVLDAAVRMRPGYPDLHYRRARLLLALRRRAEARVALDRALELNPRYAAARLDRALLDASEGYIGEALSALRALAQDTAVDEPAVYQQGLESLERADWEDAAELLSRALQLPGRTGGGALEAARALLEEGAAGRAAELLREALPGREAWPDLHYLLGSAELREGHFDDAMVSLARALELNPDFHAARLQFALSLEAVGSSSQAVEQVMLVLQSDPGHPQALALHERWTARGRRPSRAAARRDDG